MALLPHLKSLVVVGWMSALLPFLHVLVFMFFFCFKWGFTLVVVVNVLQKGTLDPPGYRLGSMVAQLQ